MAQDFDITDAEVRSFTTLVDALPDNTTSQIGANDVRAIVKSLVGRYFYMSTQEFPAATFGLPWTGTTSTAVTFTEAANFKMTANGFSLTADGDILYTGNVPMKVDLDVLVTFACNASSVVRLSLAHSNAFENILEPLLSLDCAALTTNNAPYKGSASFTVTAGSKILLSRTLVTGTTDGGADKLRMTQFNLAVNGSLLAPATSEVRRGVYGAQAAAGVLFSALPFLVLNRVTSASAASSLSAGSYGFAAPTSIAANSTTVSTVNNLLRIVSGTAWTATAKLHFTTEPGTDPQSPGRKPDIGANGDYLAYGTPTDTQVLVYGPMSGGQWPTFARSIPIRPPVS